MGVGVSAMILGLWSGWIDDDDDDDDDDADPVVLGEMNDD